LENTWRIIAAVSGSQTSKKLEQTGANWRPGIFNAKKPRQLARFIMGFLGGTMAVMGKVGLGKTRQLLKGKSPSGDLGDQEIREETRKRSNA